MLRIHKEIINEFGRLKNVKIILFGSVARGDYTFDSDIDIAVVTNQDVKRVAEKIADEVFAKYGKLVSLKFFSEREFNKEGNPIIRKIKKEGIVWKMQ